MNMGCDLLFKYTELHKSIITRLKTKYPDISYNAKRDIKKGFDRPSFFVDLDSVKDSNFMLESIDRESTVRIYYFSSTIDNNKIELYNVQDELVELFLGDNLINVNEDIKFEIEELDFNVVDKVLHCYFDVKICENYNRIDDTPVMEELELERKG